MRKPRSDRQIVRPSSVRTLGIVLMISSLGAGAVAGERYMVRRDGTRIPLEKSKNEFAVTVREANAAPAAAKRLSDNGLGKLQDFAHASKARVKLMRVTEANARTRAEVARDPDVTEVHPVYYMTGSTAPIAASGTLNVRFRPGVSPAERDALLADYRLQLVEALPRLKNTYTLRPVDAGDDEVLRAQALAGDRRVVWAEPNFRMPALPQQVAVSDTYYPSQWHLNNTGQGGGRNDADIDAPEAWAITQGEGILVGIYDDAVDIAHEDLADNYIGIGHDPALQPTDPGFIDPSPKLCNGIFLCEQRHGTAVLGLMAAVANDIGIRGVAPRARFTASRGLGDLLTNSEVATVYAFALQQEVDVHNNSWGFIDSTLIAPEVLADALETAFIQGRDLDGAVGAQEARGMVVVFASGNDGVELNAGGLETLATVIGVGATEVSDALAGYSNYGPEIDVVAPGGEFPSSAGIVTTDINDEDYFDIGYNFQGLNFDTFEDDIDPNGRYTHGFGGTSSAAPIVSGIAALILSINPDLTATDVRLILEHTAEKVSATTAFYDPVTSRSLRYGYGRVNAHAAVLAAQESLTNGGRSWPERPADVRVAGNALVWRQNGDDLEFRLDDNGFATFPRTVDEFIVLESASPISFVPADGACYDAQQSGCGEAGLTPLPDDVSVLHVGCGISCGNDPTPLCVAGAEHCLEYASTGSLKNFAVYARSSIGRYSFGVTADNRGNVTDTGLLPPSSGESSGVMPPPGPQVSISATPLSGTSPLTVHFMGNALTDLPIDESRTTWDFDIDDSITVDATARTIDHTYTVAEGDTQTFIARLTMVDTSGNSGSAQVAIRVLGRSEGFTPLGGGATLRIMIGIPGTVGSDVDNGLSPFDVQLSVDTTGIPGTLQSVRWDLGDGTTANSLFVTHRYVNTSGSILALPITVTVTTLAANGTPISATGSRTITIFPGTDDGSDTEPPPLDGTDPQGDGGAATICGVGMLPAFLLMFFTLLGRRRFSMRRL